MTNAVAYEDTTIRSLLAIRTTDPFSEAPVISQVLQ